MKSKHVIMFDFFFYSSAVKWQDGFFLARTEWQRKGERKKKQNSLAADPVTHHLAHDASVMHLRDTAGGSFKAPLAAAPAVRRFAAGATVSYLFPE